MSVELKVTLVGDDPQEQDAFNNPRTSPASATSLPAEPVAPAVSTTPIPTAPTLTPPNQNTQPEPPQTTDTRDTPAKTAPQPPPFAFPEGYVQPPPVDMQLRLIDTLQDLIESIDRQTGQTGQSSQPHAEPQTRRDDNIVQRIANAVDTKIDAFGMMHSETGRHISHLTHTIADMLSRGQKFATAAVGAEPARAAATSVASEAAGAGTAAGEAAGAGLAGAGAGTAARAAMSLSGPLIAAGLAVGAFAFTVKHLVDTIEGLANELEQYSPELAFGRAQHEVAMTLKQIDRAQRLGGDVAKVDHAMHKISESMYDVQTRIYELLLKFTPFFESSLVAANKAVEFAEFNLLAANKIAAAVTPNPDDDIAADKAIAEYAEKIRKAEEEAARKHGAAPHGSFDAQLVAILGMDASGAQLAPPPNHGNGH